jgi:predicted porin
MAAAGAASAQSSVTLFGIVDAAVTWGKGEVSDRTQLTSGAYNTSRIGFRGTEDLGGGLSASFWLEAGIEADTGQGAATNTNNQLSGAGPAVAGRQGLTFNRRSTVSLAGNWGELRLGRDIVPQYWNVSVFDPFGNVGVGASVVALGTGLAGILGTSASDPATVRASNSIGYLLPARVGGFYGQAMYYMGEGLEPNDDDGTGFGARLGFASGPFNIAGSYGKTNFAIGDFETWNVGGQWDFGVARLMGMYAHHDFSSSGGAIGDFDGQGWIIGGMIPIGAGEIKLAYSQYEVDLAASSPEAKKWAIGYVHNLSKRTAVYATYAHVNNDGSAAVSLGGSIASQGGSSSGVDVGLRHSF